MEFELRSDGEAPVDWFARENPDGSASCFRHVRHAPDAEAASHRRAFLNGVLSRVPLAHAFRYELARAGGDKDFKRYVACELPFLILVPKIYQSVRCRPCVRVKNVI